MSTEVISHVALNDEGVPYVAGTTTKVVEVIADHRFWGWAPEEIHREHPYLSLAQIYAAFAYYHDHKQEIDAEIERRDQEMEQIKAAQEETPGRQKLRDLGLRP